MHSINDYDKIIKAIDFFSQDLHEEQFSRYGYPFLHDLLNLKGSALYMIDSINDEQSPYILKNKINTALSIEKIENSKTLKNLAVFHGRHLTSDFNRYFQNDFVEETSINLVIPIINKSVLYGFIISYDTNAYQGNLDYLHVINTVINMSFSYIVNHQILEERSSLLRSEVYNLNMLTHLIAEIVSEKNLKKLYNLCIDAIRELTASSYTTVAFYDEVSEKFVTQASRDIVEHKNQLLSYEIHSNDISHMKNIYNIEKDFKALEKIFKNAEQFKRINAKYVLMMFDDRLQGFITIGETVNGQLIQDAVLYKVNTIAHFILIAVKNANYIKKIETQNILIEEQMATMSNLNEALTVINACESVDELIDVVLTTLKLQFDIEKCFFIKKWTENNQLIYQPEDYSSLVINEKQISDNFDYNYATEFINEVLEIDIKENNCLITAPIKVKEFNKERIIGYLVITQVKEKLREYQLTAIKTISQLISPVMKSLIKVKTIESHYLINKEEQFLRKVEEAIQGKNDFGLDFYVQFRRSNQRPFHEENNENTGIYSFKDHHFKIVYDLKDTDESWQVIQVNTIEGLKEVF